MNYPISTKKYSRWIEDTKEIKLLGRIIFFKSVS